MAKINFTRTVNPLQFDALEPKRFEDLVRQLLYDFRVWRQLEPTGRLGADDGFDARGWEVVDGAIADATSEAEEEDARPYAGDRVWLVQCKRERQITPKKLVGYLEAISPGEVEGLHGIILAGCCDFSKKARDDFRAWCVGHGLQEFFLWGKAELEDALFQAKNDRLLFAYFGLSLAVRRRSDQARLRSQTTIKRKLKRIIENKSEILIRDPADENYPYTPDNGDDFGWWVLSRPKLTFRGLEVLVRSHFAYLDDDGTHWDYANAIDDNKLHTHYDPWRGKNSQEGRKDLYEFWNALPEHNKGWLHIWGIIPFDRVLEVDEIGDNYTEHPHVYVEASAGRDRPFEYIYAILSQADQWNGAETWNPAPEDRIEKFPAVFRRPFRT